MSNSTPGPKLEDPTLEVRRRELSLDDLTVTMLKVVGRGNASRGARLAARLAFKAYQNEPESGEVAGPAGATPG